MNNNNMMINGMQNMNPMNMNMNPMNMNMNPMNINMNICNSQGGNNCDPNTFFMNMVYSKTKELQPQQPGKISKNTITFKTTGGVKTSMTLDNNKTIKEMILIYLKVVNHTELFGNSEVYYLYNARKININDDQTKIGDFFIGYNPTIMVNDVRNFIGAKIFLY